MLKIETLPIPFYEFHCPEEIIDEVTCIVEQMKFDNNGSETELSKEFFYHESLINWFEECLEHVKELYYIDSIKLSVVNCWATRTSFLQKQRLHDHQQSIVGGIFYLTTSQSGETVFYQDDPWLKLQTEKIVAVAAGKNKPKKIMTKILPQKGKLILYPGHIMHETLVCKEKIRYSIAFDSFFSGKIFANSKWPYVEIKTTSLKEIAQTRKF